MVCPKFYVVYWLLCSTFISTQKWVLNLDRYASCQGYENHPLVYKHTEIKSNNDTSVTANYDITVTKDLPTNLEVDWVLEKCTGKENLNSCKQFYKFHMKKLCNFYAQKNEAWSGFMTCIEPEWVCPIKKGAYKGRNCSFDVSQFKMFPLQSAYWKIKLYITDPTKKEVLACIAMEAGIVKKN